jgi:hypothetical protein
MSAQDPGMTKVHMMTKVGLQKLVKNIQLFAKLLVYFCSEILEQVSRPRPEVVRLVTGSLMQYGRW